MTEPDYLEAAWAAKNTLSGKASDRALGWLVLGIAATVWALLEVDDWSKLAAWFVAFAAPLFAFAAVADLAQYVLGAVSFARWARRQERLIADGELDEAPKSPVEIPDRLWKLWGYKLALLSAGWVALIVAWMIR